MPRPDFKIRGHGITLSRNPSSKDGIHEHTFKGGFEDVSVHVNTSKLVPALSLQHKRNNFEPSAEDNYEKLMKSYISLRVLKKGTI